MCATAKKYHLKNHENINVQDMEPRIRRDVIITNALIQELPIILNFENGKNLYRLFTFYLKSNGFEVDTQFSTGNTELLFFNNSVNFTSTMFIVKLLHPINRCDEPYKFKKVLQIGSCLCVRFRGSISDLHNAFSEILSYASKHHIELGNKSYTFFRGQVESQLILDIYFPII